MAIQAGIRPADFWDLTPYQTYLFIKEYRESIKRAHAENVAVAWLNARWQRCKEMPTLQKVLDSLHNEQARIEGSKKPESRENEILRFQAFFRNVSKGNIKVISKEKGE